MVIDAQGRAKIIKNTRRRFDNLGQLFDQALAAALSLQGYADAASEDPEAGGRKMLRLQNHLLCFCL